MKCFFVFHLNAFPNKIEKITQTSKTFPQGFFHFYFSLILIQSMKFFSLLYELKKLNASEKKQFDLVIIRWYLKDNPLETIEILNNKNAINSTNKKIKISTSTLRYDINFSTKRSKCLIETWLKVNRPSFYIIFLYSLHFSQSFPKKELC